MTTTPMPVPATPVRPKLQVIAVSTRDGRAGMPVAKWIAERARAHGGFDALDFLSAEWAYKAAGFVSYGGASGGMRSVQMAKMVMTSLKIVPLPEAVAIPFFAKLIDAAGAFDGAAQEGPAKAMLDELARWTGALATLRGKS